MQNEPENTLPELILCVFPHAEKILLLNSNSQEQPAITIESEYIFKDEFYDSIENKIRDAFRSKDFPLLNPSGVPEKIENILRNETISSILDVAKEKLEFDQDITPESISIFFFAGQVLNFSTEELSQAVSAIYSGYVPDDLINKMTKKLISIAIEEKKLVEISKKNELYYLITGQQGKFATIWDKDSII